MNITAHSDIVLQHADNVIRLSQRKDRWKEIMKEC